MNTKPSLRVNFYRVTDAIREAVERTDVFPSCLTCRHFKADNDEDICGKYNARPPARIIANACPDYDDHDDIPF